MDRNLLKKFFNGECTPEEAHRVLLWANSQGQDIKEAFEHFLPDHTHVSVDSESLKAKIKERIKEQAIVESVINHLAQSKLRVSSYPMSRRDFRVWKYAAAAVLIITASLALFFVKKFWEPQENTMATHEIVTKKTEPGQKLTIHLKDGTVVTLNSNSSVSYPKKFYDSVRLVQVSGEAFFEIAEDPKKPFIVRTESLQTTALGTSFNVYSFPEDKEEITLITGKVQVESTADSELNEILIPGERITSTTRGKYLKSEVDLSLQALWKEGIIYFDDTSIKEGLNTLELWYGVDIEVQNLPSRKVTLTGRFDNDNLRNVLTSLSHMAAFTFEIEGKDVKIKFVDTM